MRLALVGIVVVGAAGAARADVSIVDNDKTVTVDCAKDRAVELIGNHITVTLVGTCAQVSVLGNQGTVRGSATRFTVAGNRNTVTADGADAIAISGNGNTVTYKRGLARKQPAVSNVGKSNRVTRAR